MKHRKYHHELGATAGYTKRITEATTGVGKKYRKGSAKGSFFYF